jgi:hypothetical protein
MTGALSAARKYDMAAVSQRLNEEFAKSKVVQDNPVWAFCAAYSHKLGDVARIAAKASLKHRISLDDIGDKLQYTNGPALHQLWKFHRACSATAAEAVSNYKLTWIAKSDRSWWDFAHKISRRCNCTKFSYELGTTSRDTWKATIRWHDIIVRAHDALLERPCSEAVTYESVTRDDDDSDEDDSDDSDDDDDEFCQHCLSNLLGLPVFLRLLGEEVERRVSNVRHSLAYIIDPISSHYGSFRRSRWSCHFDLLWSIHLMCSGVPNVETLS